MNGINEVPKDIDKWLGQTNKKSSFKMAACNFFAGSLTGNIQYLLTKMSKKNKKWWSTFTLIITIWNKQKSIYRAGDSILESITGPYSTSHVAEVIVETPIPTYFTIFHTSWEPFSIYEVDGSKTLSFSIFELSFVLDPIGFRCTEIIFVCLPFCSTEVV